MDQDKGYNEELRARLDEYRTTGRERPLTMTVLAREVGVSTTRINKYLRLNTGAQPEGNIAELEARIEDMLKAASRRTVADVDPFETNVTRTIIATFELVRKTNDVGLISGPAGVGKSFSIRMYMERNPTAISISVPRWLRNERGLTGLLFNAHATEAWDHFTPRATWLAERLRNSNRLVIIDNAQRMTKDAREWVFDFHDETGCPIALIGNPEVLSAIRRCDQHLSRIGIYQDVKLSSKLVRDYAKALVDTLVPDPDPGLYDLAMTVAEEQGHLRALRKQLLLMQDLVDTKAMAGDQLKAFHAAHKKLVRDYSL